MALPKEKILRGLAARGELHRPQTWRAQTERLLNDPKSMRLIEAFTDYWLDLRKIDDTSPSTTLYNDYELDDPLKLAAVEETQSFVAEMLRDFHRRCDLTDQAVYNRPFRPRTEPFEQDRPENCRSQDGKDGKQQPFERLGIGYFQR